MARGFSFDLSLNATFRRWPGGQGGSALGSSQFVRHYYGNPDLVSFPPLTDMLKFSGYPLLSRGGAIMNGKTSRWPHVHQCLLPRGRERVREIAKPLANPNTQHSQRRRQQHPLLNAIQARWLVAAVCQRLPDASESFFQLSQFIICFA